MRMLRQTTLLFTSIFFPTSSSVNKSCSGFTQNIVPSLSTGFCARRYRHRRYAGQAVPPNVVFPSIGLCTTMSAANDGVAVTNTNTSAPAPVSSTAVSGEDVTRALEAVRQRVADAVQEAGRDKGAVQLVAVSKTKPIELLRAAYESGQRHFGENYVQELVTKAEILPADIQWHYIGPLQTNKAKMLASVPNLYVVETVDREKVALALEKALAGSTTTRTTPKLNVMVQVNTSGEESKSGCAPGQSMPLVKTIVNDCPHLQLTGLMTIGAPDSSEQPEAFRILSEERDAVAKELAIDPKDLQLSMGMSGDFEAAIKMGSDSVRVGSTIFGAREYPKK